MLDRYKTKTFFGKDEINKGQIAADLAIAVPLVGTAIAGVMAYRAAKSAAAAAERAAAAEKAAKAAESAAKAGAAAAAEAAAAAVTAAVKAALAGGLEGDVIDVTPEKPDAKTKTEGKRPQPPTAGGGEVHAN